jgi:iron complex outermembrane recepter protein
MRNIRPERRRFGQRTRASDVRSALCCGVLSLIIANGASYADSSSADAETPPSSQLQEITVTAEKRTQDILSVPVAMGALGADALKEFQVQDLADLAGHFAGLLVTTPDAEGNPVFAIRGVSMNDYSFNQGSPIAVYKDEVVLSSPAFYANQFYDIDRVEVLRGPQGTLYGKNATGGAVNVVTAKPDFSTGGYVTAGGGNFGRYYASGAFQSKFNDTLAYRVAFTYTKADGYQKNELTGFNEFGGVDEYGVRLTLLYRPDDRFDVTLRAATGVFGPNPYAIYTYPYGPYGFCGGPLPIYQTFPRIPPLPANFNCFASYGVNNGSSSPADKSIYGSSRYDGGTHDVSLTIATHGSSFDLLSTTAYGHGYFFIQEDADQSPLSIYNDGGKSTGFQTSQEFRLVSVGTQSYSYILGAYASKDYLQLDYHNGYFTDVNFDRSGVLNYQNCQWTLANGYYPDGCYQINSFDQERKSFAAYGDGTLKLNDTVSIRGGVRYTRDYLNATNYNAQLLGSDGVPVLNTIPGNTSNVTATALPQSYDWGKATGRVGVDVALPKNTLLYGTLSEGYRGGSVNAQAYNGLDELTVAQPETLYDAEVGLKGAYLERRLIATFSAFYYRYHDQQALNVNPVDYHETVINLSRSTEYGGEAEVRAKPMSSLQLGLNAAYLHSRIEDAAADGVNLAGKELALSPHFSGDIYFEWDAVSSNSGTLRLFGEATYTSTQYYELFNQFPISPYALVNARMTYRLRNEPVSISAWGKNLTDKVYPVTLTNTGSLGFIYEHLGLPRTYGAELTLSF